MSVWSRVWETAVFSVSRMGDSLVTLTMVSTAPGVSVTSMVST